MSTTTRCDNPKCLAEGPVEKIYVELENYGCAAEEYTLYSVAVFICDACWKKVYPNNDVAPSLRDLFLASIGGDG